jgi:acetate---CoA ligase (ADP-forming)
MRSTESVKLTESILDRRSSDLIDRQRVLWAPPAITIVGASERTNSSLHLIRNLTRSDFSYPGRINLVNPTRDHVLDLPCVPTLDDVAGDLGLVYLLVPAHACIDVLAMSKRTPSAVAVYADGFAVEPHGPAPVHWLADWSRRLDIPLIGPGCSGIVSSYGHLFGMLDPHPEGVLTGPVGLAMQSGGLMSSVARELMGAGHGVARAIAYGRGALLGCTEFCLDHLATAGDIEVVGCYAEVAPSLADLRRIGQVSQETGKPVVLVVPGKSRAGELAARSHTGALATPRRLLEGVARQFGIVLVDDVAEMISSIDALLASHRRRIVPAAVGIVSVSGGAAILSADAVSATGVDLEEPTEATRANLSAVAGDRATFNPFDTGSNPLDGIDRYRDLVYAYSRDPKFGVVVSVAGAGLPTDEMKGHVRLAEAFIDAVQDSGKLAVIAGPVEQNLKDALQWDGVVRAAGSHSLGVKLHALLSWSSGSVGVVGSTPQQVARSGEISVLSGSDCEDLLQSLELRWPRTLMVNSTDDDLMPIAGWLPVVAKTVSGVAHRAAQGGVLQGLATIDTVRSAVAFLLQRFGGQVSLSEQIPHTDEYFLGLEQSAEHGTLLAFGFGGTSIGERTGMRLAPIDLRQAQSFAASLVGGRPLFVSSVGKLLLAAQGLSQREPQIQTVDLNPLIIDHEGVITVLDAKVHMWDSAAIKDGQ